MPVKSAHISVVGGADVASQQLQQRSETQRLSEGVSRLQHETSSTPLTCEQGTEANGEEGSLSHPTVSVECLQRLWFIVHVPGATTTACRHGRTKNKNQEPRQQHSKSPTISTSITTTNNNSLEPSNGHLIALDSDAALWCMGAPRGNDFLFAPLGAGCES